MENSYTIEDLISSFIFGDPPVEEKKISSRNEFELCYMRHQYFRKIKFQPTETSMSPYYSIVRSMAGKTYRVYINLFHTVGFEFDDLFNIGKVHLVSFLGLFSLEAVPAKKDKFIDTFYRVNERYPTESDFLDKNKADLTCFLKQRMADVVRVCGQKSRNIKGLLTDEYVVLYGNTEPPSSIRELADNYDKYGYRKMDISVFKTLKKKMTHQEGPVYVHNDCYYVCVPGDHRALTITDFASAGFDPYDSIHNMTPEQLVILKDDILDFENKKDTFYSSPKTDQIKKIQEFISLHRGNPSYTGEVKTAGKMLERLL